jgi:hypothetical protein
MSHGVHKDVASAWSIAQSAEQLGGRCVRRRCLLPLEKRAQKGGVDDTIDRHVNRRGSIL